MQDLFPNIHSEEALRLFKAALAIDKRKERSKAINRALRRADLIGSDKPLEELSLDSKQIAAFKKADLTGARGIHPARIAAFGRKYRKIRDRLHDDFGLEIVGNQLRPASPSTVSQNTIELYGDIRIVDNLRTNRVQIFFPVRPPKPARLTLQCYGFRWSAVRNAWQRVRGDTTLYWARRICKALV